MTGDRSMDTYATRNSGSLCQVTVDPSYTHIIKTV